MSGIFTTKLRKELLEYWSLLVDGFYTILKTEITHEELDKADENFTDLSLEHKNFSDLNL